MSVRAFPFVSAAQLGELRSAGYVTLVPSGDTTLVDIANALGAPVPARAGGPVVQELTPMRREDAARRSLSADHGVGSFPFHTDAAHHLVPPRWLLMECVDPGPEGRATLLIDGADLPLEEAERRLLRRAVWWVRTGPRGFPASVMRHQPGSGVMLRYDCGCMTPDRAFAPAGDVIERALRQASAVRLEWQVGAVALIDNWRILHSRDKAKGVDAGIRRMRRILVRAGS